MFREKILLVLLVCFGLFLIGANDSMAQTQKGTFLGYAYLQPEGRLEHAVMVAAPDNLKQVLYLGELAELDKELAECFKMALEYEFELEITGNVKVYNDGSKSLVFDKETTCSHRN